MIAAQMSPVAQILFGYTHRTYHETRLRNARADGGQWGCSRVALGCDRFNPLDAEVNNGLTKLILRPDSDNQFRLTGELFDSDSDINQLYNRGIGTYNGDYLRNQKQTRYRLAFEHDWDVRSAALDNLTWRLSYSPQRRTLSDRRWYTSAGRGLLHDPEFRLQPELLSGRYPVNLQLRLRSDKTQIDIWFSGRQNRYRLSPQKYIHEPDDGRDHQHNDQHLRRHDDNTG